MTSKEKISLINRAMWHIFDLSNAGVLSDDEMMYLYNEFWHLRQNLRELQLIELQGVDEKMTREEICRAICKAQEIISNLHKQNNIEIKESYHLKKAFDELQEVFEAQFAKSCKSLINNIVTELTGVNQKVFKED